MDTRKVFLGLLFGLSFMVGSSFGMEKATLWEGEPYCWFDGAKKVYHYGPFGDDICDNHGNPLFHYEGDHVVKLMCSENKRVLLSRLRFNSEKMLIEFLLEKTWDRLDNSWRGEIFNSFQRVHREQERHGTEEGRISQKIVDLIIRKGTEVIENNADLERSAMWIFATIRKELLAVTTEDFLDILDQNLVVEFASELSKSGLDIEN